MSNLEKLKNIGSDKTLLYIESDAVLQKKFGIYLQKTFKSFYQADDGLKGFELFLKVKPDVVIIDLDLKKKDAIEIIVDIQAVNDKVVIITLSQSNDNYFLLQSIDMNLAGMFLKPINFSKLATKLIQVLPEVKKREPVKAEPEARKVVKTIKKPISQPIVKQKIEQKIVKSKITKGKPQKEEIKIPQEVKSEQKPKKEVQKESPIKITIPKTCMEDLSKFYKDKENILLINTYKGIPIQNKSEIIHCDDTVCELKASTAQIVVANYEKHLIIKVEKVNKFIFAPTLNLDLKNNIIKIVNPKYIDYIQRQKSAPRVTADKSFKASIFYNKIHRELLAKELSFNSILLTTNDLALDIKPNMQIDLTLGFDADSPSSLIKEKKFIKTFAKGIVTRVENSSKGMNIVFNIEVQKSGQSSYSKYLKQRENKIIEELKKIIKR